MDIDGGGGTWNRSGILLTPTRGVTFYLDSAAEEVTSVMCSSLSSKVSVTHLVRLLVTSDSDILHDILGGRKPLVKIYLLDLESLDLAHLPVPKYLKCAATRTSW